MMATQPPLEPDVIDPAVPGELPPVITPDEMPNEPEGFPSPSPDTDQPGTSPSEVPGWG